MKSTIFENVFGKGLPVSSNVRESYKYNKILFKNF
jgi:hypothetical protein